MAGMKSQRLLFGRASFGAGGVGRMCGHVKSAHQARPCAREELAS